MEAVLAAILAALAALPLSAIAAAQVYVSSFYENLGRSDALTGTGGIILGVWMWMWIGMLLELIAGKFCLPSLGRQDAA